MNWEQKIIFFPNFLKNFLLITFINYTNSDLLLRNNVLEFYFNINITHIMDFV